MLNVTAVSPAYDMSETITYKQLHAADNGYQNLKQYFEEAFDFIDLAIGILKGDGKFTMLRIGSIRRISKSFELFWSFIDWFRIRTRR